MHHGHSHPRTYCMGPQTSFLQRDLHSNWQILVNVQVLGLPSDVLQGSDCEENLRHCCGNILRAVPLHTIPQSLGTEVEQAKITLSDRDAS